MPFPPRHSSARSRLVLLLRGACGTAALGGAIVATHAPSMLVAQATVVTSPLTGLTLPAGSRADRGFLKRLAVRVILDDVAKQGGGALLPAQTHELYRLPPDGSDVAAALFAAFASAGWTVEPPQPDGIDRFAWMTRGDRRILAYVAMTPNDRWLYLAEGTLAAPAAAPIARAPVAPPANAAPVAPAAAIPAPAPAPAAPVASRTPAPAPPAPAPVAESGPRRWQFTTINYDDGWTVVDRSDAGYVEGSNGTLAVRVALRIPFTDEIRRDVREWYWRRDVAPRFTVAGAVDERPEELQYTGTAYREAQVTDASGASRYVAMLVHPTPAGGASIVVVAPDRATFRAAYPRPADLERLAGLNRFAVGPADLAGEWSESGGAYGTYVNANTGATVGMLGASTSAVFRFARDGTYTSEHKGVSGMIGSANQSVSQQRYQGAWRMNGNWELSLGNRFRGATDVFHVAFEAVPGGRILVLVDKSEPGIRYVLSPVR